MTYLSDCAERHDEDGNEKVGDGEGEDEVVGDGLEVAVHQDSANNKYVP